MSDSKGKAMEELWKAGANVNQANSYGITPLSAASSNGRTEVVEKLLEAGADVNRACSFGH